MLATEQHGNRKIVDTKKLITFECSLLGHYHSRKIVQALATHWKKVKGKPLQSKVTRILVKQQEEFIISSFSSHSEGVTQTFILRTVESRNQFFK